MCFSRFAPPRYIIRRGVGESTCKEEYWTVSVKQFVRGRRNGTILPNRECSAVSFSEQKNEKLQGFKDYEDNAPNIRTVCGAIYLNKPHNRLVNSIKLGIRTRAGGMEVGGHKITRTCFIKQPLPVICTTIFSVIFQNSKFGALMRHCILCLQLTCAALVFQRTQHSGTFFTSYREDTVSDS